MRLPTASLSRRIEAARRRLAERPATNRYARYRADPAGYARDVLRVGWWAKQVEIAETLCRPPYRVLVKASHSVGKSHLAGGLVNWWYDVHDPGVCITTAPTARQVRDVLWKEVRRQRRQKPRDAGGFPGPKIPRLESAEDHFAFGFTAGTGTSFQGQHEAAVLVILDEAVGVHREIWEAAESMVQGVHYGFLAICNPTDQGSEFYQQESRGGWTVVTIPCTDHPNVAAELRGEPPPYPQAVRLGWVRDKLRQWAAEVPAADRRPTDVAMDGKVWRPGPLAESRLLARWPSAASGVWSDALWATVEVAGLGLALDRRPVPRIGCDVARFGDDFTEIHVRVGDASVHHEAHNGWSTAETAGRLKQLAREYAAGWNAHNPQQPPLRPEDIPANVDGDGIGGGVIDQSDGYDFRAVCGSEPSPHEDYHNTRSYLWFVTQQRAKEGRLDLSRLPAGRRQELKRQAVAPHYAVTAGGRIQVEPKDVTKEAIGRSPDGMDAVNLAYYEHDRPQAAVFGMRGRDDD